MRGREEGRPEEYLASSGHDPETLQTRMILAKIQRALVGRSLDRSTCQESTSSTGITSTPSTSPGVAPNEYRTFCVSSLTFLP
ncbi:hypothetical protein [Cellulomonas sp. URHD0024]|uniref:hypothetical protein n=1 Tax=Cellulomonas sp. URHD0024 TaxID=1302620 RepID=UPI0004864554|nr:hypothetical protein [Cellulomonas sp. URHD0024]